MGEQLDLRELDPVEFAVALSRLGATHVLVAAARAAVDVADAHRDRQLAERDAAKDVAGSTDWAAVATARVHTQRMWEARAAADGPDSAAARVAKQMTDATVPAPREPSDAPRSTDTAVAVQWARQWAADRAQDEADRERSTELHRWADQDASQRRTERTETDTPVTP